MTTLKTKGQLIGKVVKVKDKTVTVSVSITKRHPLYEKIIRSDKKYHVHNPENKQYDLNSTVTIAPGKKVSKTKSFVIC